MTTPRKRFVHFNSATKATDQQVPIRIPHEIRSISRSSRCIRSELGHPITIHTRAYYRRCTPPEVVRVVMAIGSGEVCAPEPAVGDIRRPESGSSDLVLRVSLAEISERNRDHVDLQ